MFFLSNLRAEITELQGLDGTSRDQHDLPVFQSAFTFRKQILKGVYPTSCNAVHTLLKTSVLTLLTLNKYFTSEKGGKDAI